MTESSFRPEPSIAEAAGEWITEFEGLKLQEIRDQYPRCVDATNAPAWPWWPESEEPQDDVQKRVDEYLEDLLANTDEDVLLVGHGATTGAAVSSLCGQNVESKPTGSVGYALHYNAALTAIDMIEDPTIIIENCTAHLEVGDVASNIKTIE